MGVCLCHKLIDINNISNNLWQMAFVFRLMEYNGIGLKTNKYKKRQSVRECKR